MPQQHQLKPWRSISNPAPWCVVGGPDPDFDDATRAAHHALLTDPNLLTCFRRRFPEHSHASYDEMVRALGYVWDCAYDGAANVTGYRCARCARTLSATGG